MTIIVTRKKFITNITDQFLLEPMDYIYGILRFEEYFLGWDCRITRKFMPHHDLWLFEMKMEKISRTQIFIKFKEKLGCFKLLNYSNQRYQSYWKIKKTKKTILTFSIKEKFKLWILTILIIRIYINYMSKEDSKNVFNIWIIQIIEI